MQTTPVERVASAILAFEGGALFVVAGWEVLALIGGDSDDATSSIALIVLTVIGAAAVLAFSRGVWAGQSWGRSGGIVTQLLVLSVALGALAGPAPAPGFAATLAALGVIGLVALIAAVRRAGARRSDMRDAGES